MWLVFLCSWCLCLLQSILALFHRIPWALLNVRFFGFLHLFPSVAGRIPSDDNYGRLQYMIIARVSLRIISLILITSKLYSLLKEWEENHRLEDYGFKNMCKNSHLILYQILAWGVYLIFHINKLFPVSINIQIATSSMA